MSPKKSCKAIAFHERTELVFQDPGTGWIPPSPLVQFKLYQGEVLPYNPSTRDWVESTQSETPQAPTQSVRGGKLIKKIGNMQPVETKNQNKPRVWA